MNKVYVKYMTADPISPHGEVEVTVTDARGQLPELLDTHVRDGEVVYLTRYGRRIGAVVSAEVAERLGEMEDAYWSRRAAEVLARNEPTVPWHEAVAELEAGDEGGGR